MDERTRSDRFEASFVVEISREQAWERLAGATPAFEGLGIPRDGQWWIPGIEAPADELEVRPEELLRTRKAVEPCKGTEIVITVEDADNGTRITIVQTGFGPGFGPGGARGMTPGTRNGAGAGPAPGGGFGGPGGAFGGQGAMPGGGTAPADLSGFIEELQALGDSAVDFAQNVRQYLDSNNLDVGVRDVILRALEGKQ